MQGNINFLLLAGIIATILIASQWKPGVAYAELMRSFLLQAKVLGLHLHQRADGTTW